MLNASLLKTRLGQYGAAWVLGFVLTLAGIFIGVLFGVDLIVMADMLLPIGMAVLALLMVVGLVMGLLARETLGTKLVLLVLSLLLFLPLLWAPVSAAVTAAFFADRAIEYSQAYADFRINVSRVLYPFTEAVFGSGFDTVWMLFQGVATVVGFFSALANIWPRIRQLLGPDAPVETGLE